MRSNSVSGDSRRRGLRVALGLFLGLVLLRCGWYGALILSPWTEDSDATRRGCAVGAVQFLLSDATRQPKPPESSRVSSLTERFSYPPEQTTIGLRVEAVDGADGCRWLLARVPRDATAAEVRRLAVSLRHRTEPIVIISELPFLFSFGNEIIARAASVKFPGLGEMVRYPRVMVSYDLVGLRLDR